MPNDDFDEHLTGHCFQLLEARRGCISIYRAQVNTILALTSSSSEQMKMTKKRANEDCNEDEEADKSDPPASPFTEEHLSEL